MSTTTTNDKTPARLIQCKLSEIIQWRDSARKRITSGEKRKALLLKRIERDTRELEKVDAKLHSDLKWAGKLNRVISRKVF